MGFLRRESAYVQKNRARNDKMTEKSIYMTKWRVKSRNPVAKAMQKWPKKDRDTPENEA